MVFFSVKVVK